MGILAAGLTLFLLLQVSQEGEEEQPQPQKQQVATVKVRRASLMEEDSYASNRVERVKRGQNVLVLGKSGKWFHVRLVVLGDEEGPTGYLHQSSLTEARELKLTEELRVSEPEEKAEGPSLGVKGFDRKTEAAFAQKENLQPQFELLEAEVIEKPEFKRDPDMMEAALSRFIEEGGLTPD